VIDHRMLTNWTFGSLVTENRSPTFGPGGPKDMMYLEWQRSD